MINKYSFVINALWISSNSKIFYKLLLAVIKSYDNFLNFSQILLLYIKIYLFLFFFNFIFLQYCIVYFITSQPYSKYYGDRTKAAPYSYVLLFPFANALVIIIDFFCFCKFYIALYEYFTLQSFLEFGN